ncbi:MAG: adenosylmethionine--8-amino-7-oxononanoate transaminase [Bacteroidetes bacterium RIFCSPHIGHO2_02_FULL_44_7]|nr:MAG: adenosylmethionine--8-amino-7-oxononanoate transaminase [Bacteroidetes bacterium RIFCSPHIGHO2_02_FULL_44_7]
MDTKWLDDDKAFVWHPFTQHQTSGEPLPIVRAEGALLFDPNGKSYVDANSSWWVNVHGHGHPHLAKALKEQFSTLDHVVFAGVTHPKASELSRRICGVLPPSFEKVFFSDNGSTAVEVALKMAFQYYHNRSQPRTKILALEGAYHGDTFGAMSVGQRDLFNAPFEHLFFDADYLPFPSEDMAEEVLQRADELLKTGAYAAFIVEPLVQGAAGMRMYSVELLDALVKCVRQHGVLVIFDEVMTGFGRTGKMFAMEHCREIPDIVTLSKGLTGGVLPLGLTVTTRPIFDTFLSDETARGLLHGHSFTGNALACALACASLDLFEEDALWDRIKNLEVANLEFAKKLSEHPTIKGIAVLGTILRFEIDVEAESTYFSRVRDDAYRFLLEEGILLRPLGNVLFINPPYCLTADEHARLCQGVFAFLAQLPKH